MVEMNIDFSEKLTEEQLKMLEALKERPVVPDEDCPAMIAEQLQQFRKISEIKREERRKQSVTIRLSPQALKTAKWQRPPFAG